MRLKKRFSLCKYSHLWLIVEVNFIRTIIIAFFQKYQNCKEESAQVQKQPKCEKIKSFQMKLQHTTPAHNIRLISL